MAQLLVRKLDDDAKERLEARAGRNGRSLEAEARAILEEAARGEGSEASDEDERRASAISDARDGSEGIGLTDAGDDASSTGHRDEVAQ